MSSSYSSFSSSSWSCGPRNEPTGSPFIEPTGSPFFPCKCLRSSPTPAPFSPGPSASSDEELSKAKRTREEPSAKKGTSLVLPLGPSPTPGTDNHVVPSGAIPRLAPMGPIPLLAPMGPIPPKLHGFQGAPILDIQIMKIYATPDPFFFGEDNADIRDASGCTRRQCGFCLTNGELVPILRKDKPPLHSEILPISAKNAIKVTFFTEMGRITVVVIDNNFEECFVFRWNGHLMSRCFDTIVVFFKGFNDDATDRIALRTASRKRLCDEGNRPYKLATNEERFCPTSVRTLTSSHPWCQPLHQSYLHSSVDHNSILGAAVLAFVRNGWDTFAEDLYAVFDQMTFSIYTYPLCV